MPAELDRHHEAELLSMCWASAWNGILAVSVEDGVVMEANPAAARLTGYAHEELIGLPLDRLHPAGDRAAVESALRGEPVPGADGPVHLLRKDGRLLPVDLLSTGVFEVDGKHLAGLAYRDRTGQEQSDHRLAVQNWALQAYSSAALALGRAHSEASLTQAVCDAITRDSPYVLTWIGLAEEGEGLPVRRVAWAGPAASYLDGLEVSWDAERPIGRGPTGTAIRTGIPQIMQDSETSPAFQPWRERASKVGIRSSASVPFQARESRRGALMVYAARPNAFEPEAIQVFQSLADEIGHALRAIDHRLQLEEEREARAQAQARLARALTSTIQALAFTVEKRDPYTAGHQARVATIACAIAGELGWEEARIEGIRLASLVHDIGKVAVPIEILTKPSRLTPLERELINLHPGNGYAILKDIPFPWPVADIVHQHHERIDGTGYPQGLSGEAILPEARLLAVADILESMASFRPYRPALGVGVALAEVEKLSGTWLDPEMVGACVRLFREKGFTLPETHRAEAWTASTKPGPKG